MSKTVYVKLEVDDDKAIDLGMMRAALTDHLGKVPGVIVRDVLDLAETGIVIDGTVYHREYGPETAPIIVKQESGVRAFMGGTDGDAPNIVIERQTDRWALFVHPNNGDPLCYIYFKDDGEDLIQVDGEGVIYTQHD